VKTARSMGKPQPGGAGSSEKFTLTAHQEIGADVTLYRLLKLCFTENERRLGEYDTRLRRPRLVPRYRASPLPARAGRYVSAVEDPFRESAAHKRDPHATEPPPSTVRA
jgi:hypothetical protein